MLTPQDIQEKGFSKATFGGYAMTDVDDFLEEIGDDYSALFKENSTLKSNMRQLIEKVKEYRATEDAMRSALLTAQKMSDQQIAEAQQKAQQIIADARKEAAAIVADAERQFDLKKSEFGRRTAAEVEGVRQARAATAEYLNSSRQLLARQVDLLSRLEKLNKLPEPTKAEPEAETFAAPATPAPVTAAAAPAPATAAAVTAAPAEAAPAEVPGGGTKVFGGDFKKAVQKSAENDQFSFDDLDLSVLDK